MTNSINRDKDLKIISNHLMKKVTPSKSNS